MDTTRNPSPEEAQMETTYRVTGTAHGMTVDEIFTTEDEATDYASQIIDGDLDGTIEVTRDVPMTTIQEGSAKAIEAFKAMPERIRPLHVARYDCQIWEAWTDDDGSWVGCRDHRVHVAAKAAR